MSALPSPGGVVRLVITLLVAALVLLWLMSTQFPKAGQRIFNTLAPAEPGAPAAARREAPPEEGALYVWRDERGVTHIRSEAPPDGIEAQVLPFERRVERSRGKADMPGAPTGETATEGPGLPLSVYTPEGFDALMQRVEETARQLEQRNRRVEELSKQL